MTFSVSEFKRLAGERTKGGWEFAEYPRSANRYKDTFQVKCDKFRISSNVHGKENLEFIAYCGTHADAIVQRIEKLENALESYKNIGYDLGHAGEWGCNCDCGETARKALERGE